MKTALDEYQQRLPGSPRILFRFCRGTATCDEEAQPGTILCPWCRKDPAAVRAAAEFARRNTSMVPPGTLVPEEASA